MSEIGSAMSDAGARWGRVAADGTVYVRTPDGGERPVGSWQAGPPEEGLAHFARRYEDLLTEVRLLQTRIETGRADPRATLARAAELRAGLGSAAVVGDLAELARRLDAVTAAAQARQAELTARKAAARAEVTAIKQRLTEEAEALAESTQWKVAGDRLRELAGQWPRGHGADRRAEDELWARFRAARTSFERRRGSHFATLDQERRAAEARKEALVAAAEALADSTDWGPTANRLKALMAEWKEAGRAGKETDEALWRRFRAAQDAFFTRRAGHHAAQEEERAAHGRRKAELLARAEAVDPQADLERARAVLREVTEAWDRVGPAPRDDEAALADRLRAVQERVRRAGEQVARREAAASNPLVGSLRDAVDRLEGQVAAARAAGRDDEASRLERDLAARRQWLAQAERSL